MTLSLAHCRTLECPVVEEQVPGPFYDFLRFVFGDDVISGVSWSYGRSRTNVYTEAYPRTYRESLHCEGQRRLTLCYFTLYLVALEVALERGSVDLLVEKQEDILESTFEQLDSPSILRGYFFYLSNLPTGPIRSLFDPEVRLDSFISSLTEIKASAQRSTRRKHAWRFIW